MSFNDIVGQKRAKDIVCGQIISNKIPHAFLFIGPEGTGRKKTAYELAKSLNCSGEKTKNYDPCDQCQSCMKISKALHPDVLLIDFEWQARLEDKDLDKQKTLKIDTIRALQKEINLKPVESRWKIYIIEPAEKITLDAANSLLKTLEEPPSWTVIILLAAHKENLPATIVSRAQIVPFSPLPEKEVVQFLNDKFSVPFDRANEIAADSEGSFSAAINKINDTETEFSEIWNKIKKADLKTADILKISQAYSKNADLFLDKMLSSAKKDFRSRPQKFKASIDSIINARKLLESNCNPQMVLDVMLMEATGK